MKLNLFKLFGVNVKLHWSWFLLLLVYVDFGTGWTSMLFDVLTLIMVFTFVLIHEFGHILAAKRYGVKTEYVVLNLFGGIAMVDDTIQDLTPKKQMWVVFAGPLTNIIMMLMLLPVGMMFANGNTDISNIGGVEGLIYVGIAANFLMFVFNLLPIYPMDGGRLLRSILDHFDVKGAQYYSIRVTQAFSILLFIFTLSSGSIIGSLIAVIFFFLSVRELKTLSEEIYGYEYDKIHKAKELGEISPYEAYDRNHQLNLDYLNNKLFFNTDYKQKRVRYGSTEDSE
jgi:Zn-dependent protease